jgi:hypothetical protein
MFTARSAVAARIARSVAPHVAIAVTIAAVAATLSISITAADGSIAIVARVAMCRPITWRVRR